MTVVFTLLFGLELQSIDDDEKLLFGLELQSIDDDEKDYDGDDFNDFVLQVQVQE